MAIDPDFEHTVQGNGIVPATKANRKVDVQNHELLDYKSREPQWKDLFDKFAEGLATVTSSGTDWPLTVTAHAEEWWRDHLTAPTVKIVALMFGLDATRNKTDIVAELVARRRLLVPMEACKRWYSLAIADESSVGLNDPILVNDAADGNASFSENAAPDSSMFPSAGAGPSVNALVAPNAILRSNAHGSPNAARNDNASASLHAARNGNAPSEQVGSGQLGSPLVALTQEQFRAILSKTPLEAAEQPAVKSTSTAWLDRIRDKIRAFTYVDITALCVENREKMKKMGFSRVPQKTMKLGDFVVANAASEEDDFSGDMDPLKAHQGLEFYILLHSEMPEMSDRVADILRLKIKLGDFHGPTARQRVVYIKEFMYKYQGEANASDWCGKFESDISLMTQYLLTKPVTPVPRTQESKSTDGRDQNTSRKRGRTDRRAADRGQARDRPLARGRGNQDNGGRDRGHDRRDNSRYNGGSSRSSPGPCFSRTDPTVGDCRYQRCRFSHACGTCGENHPAAACPNWDSTKTRSRRA